MVTDPKKATLDPKAAVVDPKSVVPTKTVTKVDSKDNVNKANDNSHDKTKKDEIKPVEQKRTVKE